MSFMNNFTYIVLLVFLPLILICPVISQAQIADETPKWSVGIGGGVLTGSIPTGGASSNVVSDRFNVNEDFYPSLRVQAGYHLTDFESIELNVTSGSFSVFTDFEFWPDLLFKNQFYTGTFSTRFRLKRVFPSLPDFLDIHSIFGLGLLQSNHSVSPYGSTGTSQIELENDKSSELSFLFTFGAGLDIPLSKNLALFFEYDYKTINRDLIDRQLAGEILNNDFIQTTSNWSTFSTGIRIRFGKSRKTIPSVERDFEFTASLSDETTQPVADEEIVKESTDDVQKEPAEVAEKSTDEEPDAPAGKVEELSGELPAVPAEVTSEIEKQDTVETDSTIMGNEGEEEMIIPVPEPTQDLEYPEPASDFGLFGNFQEEISEGFTIIIHSFTNPELAESTVSDLQKDGYRAFIQSATVNEIDYFRVAIGQFENRNHVREAVSNLPESYQNNYFLSTLQ